MSDTGNTCQGCGNPQKPATLYCMSCGLPVASAPGGADDTDIPTVIGPAKRAAARGNAGSAANAAADQPPVVSISPAQPAVSAGAQGGSEWRPGQDWNPGAGWQQEQQQQVPWWLTPQQGQQGLNQQGLGHQGLGLQGAGPLGREPLGPVGTNPQTTPSGGQRPSRVPLIAVTIAAVALLGAGASAFVIIAHPFSSSSTSSTPTPTTPAPTPTTSGPYEQQAATALNGLLSQSAQDRAAINAAYSDGLACASLASDQSTFKQAAANRQALLSQLGSLHGANTLPSAMLSDLTNAWQVSIQADNDYAQWISDESTSGCTQQDPSFQAATTPNSEATTDKNAFISLWNPLAAQYGLTQYNQSTL